MVETTLPDLPFSDYGKAELNEIHSSAKTTRRTYPRTDLQMFTPWTSFPEDIHQAIQSAAPNAHNTPFKIEALKRTRIVENEEGIRAHAIFALHDPVEQVVKMLGVTGSFRLSGGGNAAVIGSPDFTWIMHSKDQPHPKLIVEYKAWWAANLDFPKAWDARDHRQNILDQQSLDALQQIYGYMTFNNNKFGILTNWNRAWFLRRVENSNHKTLEYFLVELDGASPQISMLKAWVGMVLLANNDWFYASPTQSEVPPGRNFGGTGTDQWMTKTARNAWKKAHTDAGGYNMHPDQHGQYQCLPIDFRLCHFHLSSARHGAHGCVVTAQFLTPSILEGHLSVVCKVVDVLRYPVAGGLLEEEVRAYAALHHLQGQAIPKVFGFYQVWGILKLLALQPVGDAIPEDGDIDQKLCQKMKAALRCIHNAQYVHGDIARRNFCTKGSHVFLVDLERCRPALNQAELDNEMNEVDRL